MVRPFSESQHSSTDWLFSKLTFCLWCFNAKDGQEPDVCLCRTTEGIKPANKLRVQNYLEYLKCLTNANCYFGRSCVDKIIATCFSIRFQSLLPPSHWNDCLQQHRPSFEYRTERSGAQSWVGITQEWLELTVTSDIRYKHTHARKQGTLRSCEGRGDLAEANWQYANFS